MVNDISQPHICKLDAPAPQRSVSPLTIREFLPHPLLRGGHAQTLAGVYLPGPVAPYAAQQHVVSLEDGDRIVLHDDQPAAWRTGDRIVLMIHGLAGCHLSSYMRRISYKLSEVGFRVFRMDLRGCGAGFGLAKLPYHSGRSDDAAAAIRHLALKCPGSPVTLAGFSLGGNITLKLLGELGAQPLGGLDSALAVSPPVDLHACIRMLNRPTNRLYDRHFLRSLQKDLLRRRQHFAGEAIQDLTGTPRRLWEFDDLFTAPVCGFGNANNYYTECSSLRTMAAIRRPTLIIAAKDDPLIPAAPLESVEPQKSLQINLARSGGHLGFVARSRIDPDRRWIDWRAVDWVQHVDRELKRSA